MPFSIERNDLAQVEADAIVIAANEQLQITGGVGATVAEKAGREQLQRACDEIGFCPTGCAVATPGFGTGASVIVHAVGPIWREGERYEESQLRATYDNALRCAVSEGASSIALPLLSAGTYGVPPEVSFRVATEAVRSFLLEHDADVKLVLYSRGAVAAALQEYGSIAEYIDDHYIDEHAYGRFGGGAREYDDASITFGSPYPQQQMPAGFSLPENEAPRWAAAPRPSEEPPMPRAAMKQAPKRARRSIVERVGEAVEEFRLAHGPRTSTEADWEAACETSAAYSEAELAEPVMSQRASLSEMLDALDAPFSTTLLALIDARGMTDAQVYKRANMSRQLFSKIRSDASYRPTKKTVLALAIALKLDLDETDDLLRRAGFALSNSSKADVIVEYFIDNGKYDIFAINEALYAFDQPLL